MQEFEKEGIVVGFQIDQSQPTFIFWQTGNLGWLFCIDARSYA
jgi:hypothetical protein